MHMEERESMEFPPTIGASSSSEVRSSEAPVICVVLSVFNGQKFLEAQLESIKWQTWNNWILLIADDGSMDDSCAIIEAFQRKEPHRVHVAKFPEASGSPTKAFLRLLNCVPANILYVALCDQDDIWFPEKLETLYQQCRQLDRLHPGSPGLIYSDLMVVDEHLHVTAPSFARSIRVKPAKVSFEQLLLENSIPGCSMLFNRPLLSLVQRADPSDPRIIMHDWWIALAAFGSGEVWYVPKPLMSYRQHSNNVVGSVTRFGLGFMLNKARELRTRDFKTEVHQAATLLRTVGSQMRPQAIRSLSAFVGIYERSKVNRVAACYRHGILKQTVVRRVQQVLAI